MILTDRAYAELRARILDLRLRPGQPVSELGLAANLGMDRVPIHEALVRLQGEELVEPVPRRGFCVTRPTVEAMREIYEIVGALEGQAVRRAAREGGTILIAALEGAITAQEAGAEEWAHEEADQRSRIVTPPGTARLRAGARRPGARRR